MGRSGSGGGTQEQEDRYKYTIVSDAKDLLDRIGEDIYKIANEAALKRSYNDLQGFLSLATYPKDRKSTGSTPSKSCDLHYNFHTNVTSNVIEPCKHKSEKRFSDTQGAECDYRKIKCKKDSDNECGACAPYRRLHVCDKNLEQLTPEKITTHNLLVDVCQAAKFEGESIRGYYALYDTQYPSSGSTMCTMLARSFADIGDIVRGRDLFLGYNETDRKEKKQLQQNLKNIFGIIYGKLKNGKKWAEAKKHYGSDENFFKLREDWWNANRETVWDAITCEAQGFNYFRHTCGTGEKRTQTGDNCQCIDQTVPTYFDYVPQYLRWFEEWAEDFCRLRKHKLQNAIKNCRGDSGKERYCDLNGYNCEETARGRNKFAPDSNCHKCSVACDRFVKWIDNQKKEFEKQEKKYTKEIKKDHGTTLQVGKTTINNLYVDDFYKILKKYYPTVDKFLEKLSKEKICEKQPEVEGKGKSIDFNDEPDDIFSRTKYCRACPLCGVNGPKGKWKDIDDGVCANLNKKKNYKEDNITDIPVLTPEKGKTGILKKYETFCATGVGQIKKWECYYDEDKPSGQNNNCILGKWESFTGEEDVMSYNAFFWKWVSEMLDDSIKWRAELDKCLKNDKKTCGKKKCNRDCKCYKKWVKKKETEWEEIEKHFRKQKDMENEGLNFEMALKILLNDVFLQDMIDANGDPQQIAKIKELKEKKNDEREDYSKAKTIIDLLIDEEEQDADECVTNNPDNECKQAPTDGESPLRSDTPTPSSPAPSSPPKKEDSDSEEEEEEEEGEGEDHTAEDTKVNGEVAQPEPTTDKTTPLDVCNIVETLFTTPKSLDEACKQKYDGKYYGWRCVPTTSGGEKTTGKSDTGGSICIPPRRRRLYVGKLTQWASQVPQEGGGNDTAGGSESPQSSSNTTVNAASTETTLSSLLRQAFIQSAAVETFFAWYEYKEDKIREDKEKKEREREFALFLNQEEPLTDKHLQKELEKGEIPEEFLRQMFYTFGDYKDILFGKDIGIDMGTVKTNIGRVFNNGGNKSDEERKNWWKNHGPSIWEGMLCALTYDTKTKIKDESVSTELTKENNKNTYDNVTISSIPINSGNKSDTTLLQFTERPTFFRWLEEWGEEFCRKRTDRLAQIKHECRGKYNNKHCDADGHDCKLTSPEKNKNLSDLDCPGCAKECMKYKTWIGKKFEEFKKQENTYKVEHRKLNGNSNGDNKEFCDQIKEKKNAADFLKALKHCKDAQNNSEEKGNQEDKLNKINFDKPENTFNPSTYCKTCPFNGVNCNGSGRGKSGTNGCTTNTEPANKDNAEGVATTIPILINDGSTNGATNGTTKDIDEELKNCSEKYSLFKGLSKQVWTCQYLNGVDQCKLTNSVDNIDDSDKIIPFNVFFQRWLRDFVRDYNILKGKIKACIKNENEKEKEKSHKCIKECNDKCKCVEEWLDKKEVEWKKIKEHYDQQKTHYGYSIPHWVKSYFEQEPFDTDYKKAQEVVENPNEREELWGNTGRNYNNRQHTQTNDDFITNLISKLQDKIKTCQNKHNPSGETKAPCEETPLDDDTPDEPLDDYYIQQPKICPPPMTCVEKIAKELRVEAEENAKTYDQKLKGKGENFNGQCNMVKKNDTPSNGKNNCDFDKTYKNSLDNITKTCEGGYNVSDSTVLLKKVQEIARNEGDDIIRKLLEQNSCDEHRICDAMKYSFADLGDIIRGRDLWNTNRKEKGVQQRLRNIFKNIYNDLRNDQIKSKYSDPPFYYKLRSDWWDANRKHIWNAMTCNAPDDAKFLKKNPNDTSGSSSAKGIMTRHPKCGYDKEPPDYDYIPQPFRWMQEWSEYYCKLLNEEIKKFATECKECRNNGSSCKDDTTGKKCENCKKQCEKYKNLVDKWKSEFDKYKETYKEIYNNNNNNNNKAKISSEEYFKKFLEKLKAECTGKDTADKYLDEASHCTKYKFIENDNNSNDNYAFKHTPKDFEQACKCEAPDPLDECPKDNKHVSVCKNLSPTRSCESKTFNNDDDSWTSVDVKDSKGKNHGVLVPPRRRQLCIRNMNRNLDTINNISDFKKIFLQYVYTEGYYLWHKYKNDNKNALDAMHYSFYDYGDIVKGTDLISTILMDKLKTKLNVLLKEDGGNERSQNRGKWWANNKNRVWNAMLCGYKKAGGTIGPNDCNIPSEENTHQFLRWFREWSEHFCARQQKLFNEVKRECESAKCNNENGKTDNVNCEGACVQYKNYITRKIEEYRLLNYQYNVYFKKQHAEGKNAPEYFINKCNSKCNCLSQHIDKEKKWKNIYDSLGDNNLKNKCDCIKIKPQIIPNREKPKEETKPPLPDLDPLPADEPFDSTILQTTIPFGVALALGSIAFLFLKKKTKSTIDLLRVINIPKSDYDIPTKLSPNRYIPYTSGKYRGKRYIYLEGDSGTDSGYTDHYSDITSSSESEYEEMDINDIYVPGSPKYKTLIEVVLEPSGKLSGNTIPTSGKNTPTSNIPSDNTPTPQPITDNEWNTLKQDFISNMLQSEQPKDVPNDYKSGDIPFNTQPNTLYFNKPEEKPFIMSIHDRNLYTGEEISYNVNMSTNSMDDPKYVSNNVYSGIDLINDSLSGGKPIDIYDELLKRKENELFGTNNPKRTSTYSVAKLTNSDPIHNQLELFHKWLDRHRDMCEKWNNKEEVLDKLKEEWNKDNNNNSGTPSDNTTPTTGITPPTSDNTPPTSDNTPPTSDIPSGNHVLNTDVSIQIHMDDPKPINEFTNMDTYPNNSSMDTILEDLEKYNEPYYYDMYDDDIYYDVNDHDTSTVDSNNMDVPSKVQIEMDINTKLVKEKYPIADVWDI
ncbi:hypothetical protein PFDG_00299 [Plasmodium falciparum Dd2]|uniref:Erythrocyte membrane protein 1 n=1 Tax=Plasmodium falciparum (isolate Dd2) TaxID=57267 RepID=A0A0L7LWA3_PLAF4|nr:hypothetical protein PFDG_00299 [Plasmodium falciparum Dd2]